jgi:hypothetical protein
LPAFEAYNLRYLLAFGWAREGSGNATAAFLESPNGDHADEPENAQEGEGGKR